MTDVSTHQRLRVRTEGTAGPYLIVPVSQLDELTALFTKEHIRHWVGENAISLDGKPATVIVNLGRNGDAAAVQTLLDSVH